MPIWKGIVSLVPGYAVCPAEGRSRIRVLSRVMTSRLTSKVVVNSTMRVCRVYSFFSNTSLKLPM